MKLYVVRHGVAEDPAPGRSDEARRLTGEGRRDFARGVEGLARLGIELERVLTSPLVRARETAEILAKGLAAPDPELCPELAPGVTSEAVLRALRGAGERVAVVGHEPGVGFLVSTAAFGSATDATPLRKGGVACLEFAGPPRPGAATLAWLLTPKQLRRLA
jgi:phosphohistidine phosphatase